MPNITIVFSLLYVITGLLGFFLTGAVHYTALIPTAIGLILLVLGWIAKKGDSLRKHSMHGAMLLGLLSLFATAPALMLLPAAFAGTVEPPASPASIYAKAATALLSLAYLGLGVRSFIQARRSRSA